MAFTTLTQACVFLPDPPGQPVRLVFPLRVRVVDMSRAPAERPSTCWEICPMQPVVLRAVMRWSFLRC